MYRPPKENHTLNEGIFYIIVNLCNGRPRSRSIFQNVQNVNYLRCWRDSLHFSCNVYVDVRKTFLKCLELQKKITLKQNSLINKIELCPCSLLPPANEVREGNILHVFVCLLGERGLTPGGGGGLPRGGRGHCLLGRVGVCLWVRGLPPENLHQGRSPPPEIGSDESVGFAVKLVRETKIWVYIHNIYSHTTNLYES